MQSEAQEISTVMPSPVIVATVTINLELPTFALLTLSYDGALPTIVLNTPVIGTPAPYSTPDINKFELPYFESTVIPGLLQANLTIEDLASFNGYKVKRISGWRYGFKDLEWMDANHLLLYPTAGIYNMGGGQHPGIFPAVINLDSGKFWIPLPNKRGGTYYPVLPRWSEELGVLIAAASDSSVAIYSPDGIVQKNYDGNFLGVSPSATKLLIDDTWIDLNSGKTVQFAWQQDGIASQRAADAQFRPIWSPDETRVYNCCYLYGDAQTGESLSIPYYAITLDGENTKYNFDAMYGTWVLNGKYFLPIWGGVWDGRYATVYLFDPIAKSYRNLSKITGLPDYPEYDPEPYCDRPSAQNGGRYIWVDCMDGSHLIDLSTFRSQAYPPFGRPYGEGTFDSPDAEWSADGNSVWFNQDGAESILSASTGEMKLLPKNCAGFDWHPKDNILLAGCDYGQSILLLDGRTLSVQKQVTLPAKFAEEGWSSDGNHIALLADDNSLWQLDYPNLDNLRQVTPAMPELKRKIPNSNLVETLIQNVVWSPDNSAVAFIGGDDIYVVQIESKP
jgi:hypothetical protein